uniref:Uncharacterized protein n=1 Tax=Kalanchoe fedtschenkoi TaxID=63787 RepID=A0A7N0UBL0_KALFE
MASGERKTLNPPQTPPPPETISSPSDGWIQRIVTPTAIAGVVGGCAGTVSKHRKVHGLAHMSATYAANLAIVAATYCGMREMVRASRHSEPDDLINSALGGFASGALLGRLQAGQLGAVRYSVGFAVIGTAIDYATQRLRPKAASYMAVAQNVDSWRLPEWSPIQIMDEEERAAKKAREKQLYEERRRQLGLSDDNS